MNRNAGVPSWYPILMIIGILALMAVSIGGWVSYGHASSHLEQACQVLHQHHLSSEGCK